MQSEPLKYYYSRFRLFLFRSPLLKESIFLSFPVGTKMFQFPTFPLNALLYSCASNQTFISSWVSPFRHPRITEYLLLPVAFRSLSRLSSALGAKSFTLCSQQLNLFFTVNVYKTKICFHFGLIVFTYFRMLVLPINYFRIYLYIFQCANRYFIHKKILCQYFFIKYTKYRLVGSNGIEPSTSRLSGVRSNHLSYEPISQSSLMFYLLYEPTLFTMYQLKYIEK